MKRGQSSKIRVYQREDGRWYVGQEPKFPRGYVQILSRGFETQAQASAELRRIRREAVSLQTPTACEGRLNVNAIPADLPRYWPRWKWNARGEWFEITCTRTGRAVNGRNGKPLRFDVHSDVEHQKMLRILNQMNER